MASFPCMASDAPKGSLSALRFWKKLYLGLGRFLFLRLYPTLKWKKFNSVKIFLKLSKHESCSTSIKLTHVDGNWYPFTVRFCSDLQLICVRSLLSHISFRFCPKPSFALLLILLFTFIYRGTLFDNSSITIYIFFCTESIFMIAVMLHNI